MKRAEHLALASRFDGLRASDRLLVSYRRTTALSPDTEKDLTRKPDKRPSAATDCFDYFLERGFGIASI
jgi:hypothetical protein